MRDLHITNTKLFEAEDEGEKELERPRQHLEDEAAHDQDHPH